MSDERKRILQMFAEGKISLEECDELLEGLGQGKAKRVAAAAKPEKRHPMSGWLGLVLGILLAVSGLWFGVVIGEEWRCLGLPILGVAQLAALAIFIVFLRKRAALLLTGILIQMLLLAGWWSYGSPGLSQQEARRYNPGAAARPTRPAETRPISPQEAAEALK